MRPILITATACALILGGCGETKVTATGNDVEAYRSGNWNDTISIAADQEIGGVGREAALGDERPEGGRGAEFIGSGEGMSA